MCHDHDSHPPIAPIAGGALDGVRVELTAADGNQLAAFRARPTQPRGTGVVILPDVRGLHPFYEELALRFAEHGVDAIAIDWFGRTAGVGRRGEGFEHMPHVERTTWDGNATDIAAGVQALRDDGVASVFTIGFCMGGRMSFLAIHARARPRRRHRVVRDAPRVRGETTLRRHSIDSTTSARRSWGCSVGLMARPPPTRSRASTAG